MKQYVFALACVAGILSVNAAEAREPRTLAGKCAKELGAPYDPVRNGWYYTGPNHRERVAACVAKKSGQKKQQ